MPFFFSRLLCSPSHTFCKAHSSAQPRTPGPRPMAKGPASRLARPGAGADGRDPAVAGRRGRGAAGLDLCQVSGTKREARLCVHGNAF